MTSITKEENPWDIKSIYELQYFNCRSCVYKNHFKQEFINHAYEFHPEAIVYLTNIQDGSLNDINIPWDINNIETKVEPIDDDFPTKEEPIDYDYIDDNDYTDDIETNDSLNAIEFCETKMNAAEKSTGVSKTVKKNHKCETCQKSYASPYKLKQHISSVHEEHMKNFKCETCGKSYRDGQKYFVVTTGERTREEL